MPWDLLTCETRRGYHLNSPAVLFFCLGRGGGLARSIDEESLRTGRSLSGPPACRHPESFEQKICSPPATYDSSRTIQLSAAGGRPLAKLRKSGFLVALSIFLVNPD